MKAFKTSRLSGGNAINSLRKLALEERELVTGRGAWLLLSANIGNGYGLKVEARNGRTDGRMSACCLHLHQAGERRHSRGIQTRERKREI